MNNINQKYIGIIAVIAVVIIAGLSYVVLSKKATKPVEKPKTSQTSDAAVIPTVDSAVKVDVIPTDASNHEVSLNIKGIPSGTKSIEYEMSYDTQAQGLQGIVPDEPVDVTGKTEFSKKFLLGTESSGVKTYHVLVGPVKISLKFNGSYGTKSFEHEFVIN